MACDPISAPASAPELAVSQLVSSPLTHSAIFLVVTINPGEENRAKVLSFCADLLASDWRPMTPDAELKLVMQRLNTLGRGIVLFHDTKAQTATMLPGFLDALREQNFRVVTVVPAP